LSPSRLARRSRRRTAVPLDHARHDGRVREQPLQPADDHLVAGFHTTLDLSPAGGPNADRHLALIGFAVLHHPHERRALHREQRVLGHDDGIGPDGGREPRLDEHASLELMLVVRDARLDENRAARQRDHGVYKYDLA